MKTIPTPQASKEWMEQFRCGGGAPALTCSCGRTHVAVSSPDFDEGELQRYEASARENPKSYVLHGGCDSVSEHTINGQCIVDECECGTMAKFEAFVLRERELILGYYKAVAARAAGDAASIHNALAELSAAGEGTGG